MHLLLRLQNKKTGLRNLAWCRHASLNKYEQYKPAPRPLKNKLQPARAGEGFFSY